MSDGEAGLATAEDVLLCNIFAPNRVNIDEPMLAEKARFHCSDFRETHSIQTRVKLETSRVCLRLARDVADKLETSSRRLELVSWKSLQWTLALTEVESAKRAKCKGTDPTKNETHSAADDKMAEELDQKR
jgi:hypothetical protein